MKTFRTFIFEEAPANNTGGVPGAGDDSSLHMKKMRSFKAIWRRHRIKEKVGDISPHSSSLYYLQPDGSYIKGGDARSEGLTKTELIKAGKTSKIK